MTDDFMADETHPQIAALLKQYARDLHEISPTPHLDARIDQLVATPQRNPAPRVHHRRRWPMYAAAAGFAALATGVGIFIGMKLEHTRKLVAASPDSAREAAWPLAELSMWPTDSVSFKIPAEYSAQGTLVAVDPKSKNASARYWIDVVVSNDGTFRIEQIVPADSPVKGGQDGVTPQIQ
jgi:hypothetical protein